MEVKQISALLNDVFKEVTGQLVPQQDGDDELPPVAIIQEDLSDIVTVGTTVMNASWKDNFCKALIDRIGREVYVSRAYRGYAPNVYRDSWEYGSIMTKVRCKMFEAEDNPAWSLQKGQSVDQFVYTPPEVSQRFFNSKTSWEIDCSFTDVQLQESFRSAEEMNRFISMIETTINNSKTIYKDSLVMRTINNFIGEKLYSNNGVIDLLAGYNETLESPITAAQAMRSKEFFRYAALQIKLFLKRFAAPSTNFNEQSGEFEIVTFTPEEYSHLILHDDLAQAIEVYLQSDTYHDDLVKLTKFETVPFWQIQGDKYQFANTSRIDVKLASSTSTTTKTVNRNYILGILFDRDALGVLCDRSRVNSSYNAKGEYYNNFYKEDCEYFNSLEENALVFVLGDGNIPTIELDKSTLSLTVGGATGSLSATVSPVGSNVTWSSSDTSKATVSSGTVTAVAAGTATITASITVDGVTYSAECAVTVAATKSKKSKAEPETEADTPTE